VRGRGFGSGWVDGTFFVCGCAGKSLLPALGIVIPRCE
jgi:hypothetical protein